LRKEPTSPIIIKIFELMSLSDTTVLFGTVKTSNYAWCVFHLLQSLPLAYPSSPLASSTIVANPMTITCDSATGAEIT
jgi:hypothetical protein